MCISAELKLSVYFTNVQLRKLPSTTLRSTTFKHFEESFWRKSCRCILHPNTSTAAATFNH